jgi:hypothetical protein
MGLEYSGGVLDTIDEGRGLASIPKGVLGLDVIETSCP